MKLPRANEPFQFFIRISLTAATGIKASNLRELQECIGAVPDAVLYTHTHRFVAEHQFLVPEPPNDFAVWTAEALQDEASGERLAAVDTVSYSSLGELREALHSALEESLKERSSARSAPEGEEFHFLRSIRFSVATNRKAWDLAEFSRGLGQLSLSSLYLHVFEAKLRPPLGVNDFSVWLERELDEKALAQEVARLDPYTQTLESIREKIVGMVEDRIAEIGHA